MRVLLHVGVIAALALNAEAQVCTTTIQLSTAQDILAVIQNIGDSVKSISGDVAAAQKQVTALLNQASPPPPPTMPPAGKTTIICQKIPSHDKLRACFSVEGFDKAKKTWTSQGMKGKDGKQYVAKLTGNGIGVGTDKNGQKGLVQDMKYVYGRYSDKFESPDILGLNALHCLLGNPLQWQCSPSHSERWNWKLCTVTGINVLALPTTTHGRVVTMVA